MPESLSFAQVATRLPSLDALRVFYSAARLGSMARAAQELCVTPGAVSRRITALEADLGIRLFERGNRGVELSEAGTTLFTAIERLFGELDAAVGQLAPRPHPKPLVIGVPRSYGARFLARRIGLFRQLHPEVNVRLDTARHTADLTRGEADLAIRWGRGNWPDLAVQSLGEERLFPVCAPRLLERATLSRPADLRHHTLLHFAELPDWAHWLHAHPAPGVDPGLGPCFSDSNMLLAAAEAGAGVAIGRTSLVADALAEGTLLRPFAGETTDGYGYFLAASRRAIDRPAVRQFSAWLISVTEGRFENRVESD